MDRPTVAPGSPFHEGEQRLQTLTGLRDRMEQVGQTVIRPFMPDQHRDFFAQLPFVLVGGLDAGRQPWATVWAGAPGFMHSPDPRHLHLQPCQLRGDPLAAHWQAGGAIGLLGIEPHTRRRNRMNGTLLLAPGAGGALEAVVQVRQSFGNCPKYIQPRQASWRPPALAATLPQPETAILSDRAREIITQADTFFIASASAQAGLAAQARADGVDVSHRGGPPGFVAIDPPSTEGTRLTVPDYAGNFMFNTLGNILVEPRVGLLFLDMARSDVLWLAGRAHVDLDSPDQDRHEGAQRLLRIQPTQGWLAERALPLAWA